MVKIASQLQTSTSQFRIREKCIFISFSVRTIEVQNSLLVSFNDIFTCYVYRASQIINIKYETLVRWYWHEKDEFLGDRSVPMLLCLPQIPHVPQGSTLCLATLYEMW